MGLGPSRLNAGRGLALYEGGLAARVEMAAGRTGSVLAALGVLSVCAANGSGLVAEGATGGEAEWAEPWDGAVFRPPSALGAVGVVRSPGTQRLGREEAVDLPVLLWWSPGLFPHFPGDSERIECARGACVASRDRRVRGDLRTRALLFYGTDFRAAEAPLPRLAHQSWALLHEESPLNNFLLSHGPGIRLFNLTATFSRHSDYPLPLQWLPGTAYLRRPAPPLQERAEWRRRGYAPLLYLQSHCDVPADRDRYVRELMRYIPVGAGVAGGAGTGRARRAEARTPGVQADVLYSLDGCALPRSGGLLREMPAESGAAHSAVTGHSHSHHRGSRALDLLVPL